MSHKNEGKHHGHHGQAGYFGTDHKHKLTGGAHGKIHTDHPKLPLIAGDGMAHQSHHDHNKMHGTPNGFGSPFSYQDGGCDHHLGDNVADED